MENNEFTGKSVEEAVEAALAELKLSREQAEVEVLDEGKKKLFGGVPARVKVTAKEKLSDGERAVRFLEGLFPILGLDVTPTLSDESERIVIELAADEARGIIGRRGEMIDAVQTLAGAVANTGRRDYKRVVVDCGNYREEREATLKRVAEKLAAKAVRLGKRVRLEPMNPYERRIIHSALAESDEVTTSSEGKEPQRFVVIIPKNLKQGGGRKFDRDGKGKGGKFRKDNRHGDRNDKFGGKKYPKRELLAEDTPQTSGTMFRSGESGSGFRKGGFSGFFGTYLGKSDEDENNGEE